MLVPKRFIRFVHHAVDIHLRDPMADAFPVDLGIESIGAVQHEPHFFPYGFVHGVEALVFQLYAPGAVVAVHVSEGGRKPVDARGGELGRFVRCCHDGFEFGRVHYTVFPACDASGFRFCHYSPLVTVFRELLRQTQVFGFLVVRHVYHDAVITSGVGGVVDGVFGLGVVEVEGYGDGGCVGGGGGGGGEGVTGVGLRPGEEEDHCWGGFGFGGADGGEDTFDVVLGIIDIGQLWLMLLLGWERGGLGVGLGAEEMGIWSDGGE